MILNFIALALAEEGGAAPAASQSPFSVSGLWNIAPLILLVVIFYFLLIRPQQKKAKEHKEMLGKLEKGDNIITNSGIYGRVVSTADDTVTVEIADNVRVKMAKDAVAVRKPQG